MKIRLTVVLTYPEDANKSMVDLWDIEEALEKHAEYIKRAECESWETIEQ